MLNVSGHGSFYQHVECYEDLPEITNKISIGNSGCSSRY